MADIDRFSIVTIIFFFISQLLVIFPFSFHVPLPKVGRTKFTIGLMGAPLLTIAILWASQCLGATQIRDGIVGTDGIKPYNILILFISLAYMAITLDVTGILQAAAFWVSNKGGSNGRRLYLYFYVLITVVSMILGNDPIILSGTAFLVYYTEATGLAPMAWLISEFAAANTASMVLFVGNPTNVVICEGFRINNAAFTAYTILPFLACCVACYIALMVQFRDESRIPKKLKANGELDPRKVLRDPVSACFGSILLAICLIVVIVLSFFHVDVWKIVLPFAVFKFAFDICWDHYRFKTGQLSKAAEGDAAMVDELKRAMSLPQDHHLQAENEPHHSLQSSATFTSALGGPSNYGSVDTHTNGSPLGLVKSPSLYPDGRIFGKQREKLSRIHEELSHHFPTFFTALPRLPFGLIPFAFSQFILIEALTHQGWIQVFSSWLAKASNGQMIPVIWIVGVMGIILCNIAGTNIGATILLTKIIHATNLSPHAARAAAIALAVSSNIGAVSVTFSASLAGLLWQSILKQKKTDIKLGLTDHIFAPFSSSPPPPTKPGSSTTKSLQKPLANSRTSLDSLPSEVLVRIFDHVHQEQLSSKPVDDIRLSELRTHTLFPYSLLHLCKPVRQIILRVPRFMTLVVVFIDIFNARSSIWDLFTASGTLPIDAFFISKHVQNPPKIDIEREEVRKAMQVFYELFCLERCRTLVFNVRKSSSLPPVNQLSTTSGNLPNFRTLRFYPRRLEHIPQVDKFFYGRPKTKEQRELEKVRHLVLPGTIFTQYLSLPGWVESFAPVYHKQFTIYNLSATEGQDPPLSLYTLIESIAKMGHFASLTLSNIDLDFSSCRNNRKQELHMEKLYLKGFSSEKLAAFWKCTSNRIEFTSLTFDTCGLIPDGHFIAHGLALQDIVTDTDSLIDFLQRWVGVSLDLTRCTGVNDKLLRLLCKIKPNATFHLQDLRNLVIAYCKSSPDPEATQSFLSPSLLKRLITKRMEAAEKHDPTSELYHILPMWSIYVKGEGPALSEEDTKWFRENLERFGWYTPPPEVPDLADDLAAWDWSGVVLPGDDSDQQPILSSQPSSQPAPSSQMDSTGAPALRPIVIVPYVPPVEVKNEEDDDEDELRLLPTKVSSNEPPSSQATIPNSRSSSPYLVDDYSNANWSMSDLEMMDSF
ncbi:hypothetical protein CVT24_007519 [Panaeolus cyanescens]|uniref:Citrate transporter-like domain-containing protein n=1 Tax=Panaeolus cyanescens TaxID=181874 RepID=A0A409W9U5_9AGAR|nr:hypothetical protein CVT24_007519 [Panaeolus cyanescens]